MKKTELAQEATNKKATALPAQKGLQVALKESATQTDVGSQVELEQLALLDEEVIPKDKIVKSGFGGGFGGVAAGSTGLVAAGVGAAFVAVAASGGGSESQPTDSNIQTNEKNNNDLIDDLEDSTDGETEKEIDNEKETIEEDKKEDDGSSMGGGDNEESDQQELPTLPTQGTLIKDGQVDLAFGELETAQVDGLVIGEINPDFVDPSNSSLTAVDPEITVLPNGEDKDDATLHIDDINILAGLSQGSLQDFGSRLSNDITKMDPAAAQSYINASQESIKPDADSNSLSVKNVFIDLGPVLQVKGLDINLSVEALMTNQGKFASFLMGEPADNFKPSANFNAVDNERYGLVDGELNSEGQVSELDQNGDNRLGQTDLEEAGKQTDDEEPAKSNSGRFESAGQMFDESEQGNQYAMAQSMNNENTLPESMAAAGKGIDELLLSTPDTLFTTSVESINPGNQSLSETVKPFETDGNGRTTAGSTPMDTSAEGAAGTAENQFYANIFDKDYSIKSEEDGVQTPEDPTAPVRKEQGESIKDEQGDISEMMASAPISTEIAGFESATLGDFSTM